MYGQTGAGKTHTMDHLLSHASDQLCRQHLSSEQRDGRPWISVSVVEVYNENVKDLVSGRDNLAINMTAQGMQLPGLAEVPCATTDQLQVRRSGDLWGDLGVWAAFPQTRC